MNPTFGRTRGFGAFQVLTTAWDPFRPRLCRAPVWQQHWNRLIWLLQLCKPWCYQASNPDEQRPTSAGILLLHRFVGIEAKSCDYRIMAFSLMTCLGCTPSLSSFYLIRGLGRSQLPALSSRAQGFSGGYIHLDSRSFWLGLLRRKLWRSNFTGTCLLSSIYKLMRRIPATHNIRLIDNLLTIPSRLLYPNSQW